MWNLKDKTNECISQNRNRFIDKEKKLVVTSGKRGGERQGCGIKIQTTMYKINKQEGYIVQHREIQPLFCNKLKWNIIYKNTESLCCTPETNIIL